MRKTIGIRKKRDPLKAAIVKMTSEATGVGKRQVYRVIDGDQENEKVLKTYMLIEEGQNLLLKAVKETVPFTKKVAVSF